jgi:hypothetical protein
MIQSSLSLLHQLGESRGHDFLLATNPDLKSISRAEQETALVLDVFGHSLVTPNEAQRRTYDVVHLAPSFVWHEEIHTFLRSLTFTQLFAHGDNFKNTVFVNPKFSGEVDGIVKFGINLQEEALKASKIRREAQSNPIVVSYQSVQDTWKIYAEALNWQPKPLPVNESDLLVCERYWGASVYRIKAEADLTEHLSRVLDLGRTNYKRIIFRPTQAQYPGEGAWQSATLKLSKLYGVDFTTWNELVIGLEVPDILNHPEAQFFLGGLSSLGGLFAFDGTLSLVFSSLSEKTRVHWADREDYSQIFEEIRISDHVAEQIRWMRLASAECLAARRQGHPESLKVSTDGVGHLVLHFEESLEVFQAQLDSQLTSKAALEEEIAKKDASFSWRVTKPLRALGEFFQANLRL